MSVVLVETLAKTPPVRHKGQSREQFGSPNAFFVEVDLGSILPVVLGPSKVAVNDHGLLQGRGDAREHISQEEVSEPDQAKGRNHDVSQSVQDLQSSLSVQEGQRIDTSKHEEHEQTQREQRIISSESDVHFDFGYLPDEAEDPKEKEDGSHFEELVVDDLVSGVDLKDKGVVDLALAEHVNVDTRGHDDERDDKREDVGLDARVELVPGLTVRVVVRHAREEDKEAAHHYDPA